MQIEKREVESSLPSKGFVQNRSGDHVYFHYFHDGKDAGISTKVSHSDKSIGDPLISRMKKQLRLSKSDFIDLVKCPMTKEAYEQKLKEQRLL